MPSCQREHFIRRQHVNCQEQLDQIRFLSYSLPLSMIGGPTAFICSILVGTQSIVIRKKWQDNSMSYHIQEVSVHELCSSHAAKINALAFWVMRVSHSAGIDVEVQCTPLTCLRRRLNEKVCTTKLLSSSPLQVKQLKTTMGQERAHVLGGPTWAKPVASGCERACVHGGAAAHVSLIRGERKRVRIIRKL